MFIKDWIKKVNYIYSPWFFRIDLEKNLEKNIDVKILNTIYDLQKHCEIIKLDYVEKFKCYKKDNFVLCPFCCNLVQMRKAKTDHQELILLFNLL